jgi:hypothetical protein
MAGQSVSFAPAISDNPRKQQIETRLAALLPASHPRRILAFVLIE